MHLLMSGILFTSLFMNVSVVTQLSAIDVMRD
jgi:hypothetical protein